MGGSCSCIVSGFGDKPTLQVIVTKAHSGGSTVRAFRHTRTDTHWHTHTDTHARTHTHTHTHITVACFSRACTHPLHRELAVSVVRVRWLKRVQMRLMRRTHQSLYACATSRLVNKRPKSKREGKQKEYEVDTQQSIIFPTSLSRLHRSLQTTSHGMPPAPNVVCYLAQPPIDLLPFARTSLLFLPPFGTLRHFPRLTLRKLPSRSWNRLKLYIIGDRWCIRFLSVIMHFPGCVFFTRFKIRRSPRCRIG